MSGTLNHWIGGTPGVVAGVNTGRFTHWLQGAPLIHFGSAIPRLDAGYIVTAAPHWTEPVDLTVSLPTSRTRSLSGAEARRPFGASLRVLLKWSSVLSARELHALREQVRSSGNQSFVAPLWPLILDGAAWTTEARVRGGLLLAFNADFAQWDFSTTGTLEDAAAWEFVVPAVVGRLSVKASALGPTAAMVEFTFTEDAEFDYALAVDPEAWPAGAALPDGTTPPVFPIETLWQSAPATGTTEFDIERKQIGEARQLASADYGAAPEQTLTAEVMLDTHREVARLSGNPIYPAVVEAIFEWARAWYQPMVRAPGAESLTLEEHTRLVDAIEAHRPDAAEQAVRAHLTRSNERYRSLMRAPAGAR